MLKKLLRDLSTLKNPEKAKILSGFFKTGKGQYGEGDVFLGITVPQQRIIARKYQKLSLDDAETLLQSKVHEYRLVTLLILVELYRKGDRELKQKIVKFYLKNTKYINNWDLVDLSAEKILGEYYLDRNKKMPRTMLRYAVERFEENKRKLYMKR